jgi:glycerol-3-phosphate dehydrogenase
MIGPSATEVPDKEDTSVTAEDFAYAMGRNDDPNVTDADIIRVFAGVRPADFKEDFIVERSEIVDGLIVAGAIQSPGIGASPAIAERVEEILRTDFEKKGMALKRKENFDPIRKAKTEFAGLSHEEQARLIKQRPEYGRVVCRCETITEGEILDAVRSNVTPTSIDAIKRRTRAGMGRCQGGFCQPHILKILARELNKEWVEINLNRENTAILKKENR